VGPDDAVADGQRPADGIERGASAKTRPTVSCPSTIGKAMSNVEASAPSHAWTSLPQIAARSTRTSNPPGSGASTGNSRSSRSAPHSVTTAARPYLGISAVRLMENIITVTRNLDESPPHDLW
jgi:hypothetical protein